MKLLPLLAVIIAVPLCGQSPTPDLPFRWEANTPLAPFKGSTTEQNQLVDRVIKNVNAIDSMTMYAACSTAYRNERMEDAAFLYYMARIRAKYDLSSFPPSRSGSESPGVYLAFLNENARQVVLPWLYTHIDAYIKVANRLLSADAEVIKNYQPGWEHQQGPGVKPDNLSRSEFQKEYLFSFRNFSKLFQIKEYADAYMAINPWNPETKKLKATPEGKVKYDQAVAVLKQIESENKIEGISGSL